MPTGLPTQRSGLKIFGLWSLLNLAIVLGLIAAAAALNRYGIGEILARFEGKSTFSKQEPGPANLPTIVRPGGNPGTAPGGSKLPEIIRPGSKSTPPVIATGAQPKHIEVVDGDTIRADGRSYRLVGIDTPESGPRAKCAAEREKAARASKRLSEIVAGSGLRLDRVSCHCAVGTEGTDVCNHGRYCGVLTSGGRDVGLILIGEGLAKRYDCSAGHCPPKQSWCS